MKLTSLITSLLMSSALIQGAATEEDQDRTECDSQYFVMHACSDEHPDIRVLTYGGKPLETIYFDTLIRKEEKYDVCMTDDPFSHAFVPNNPETLQEWQSVASFLVELTAAGLDYALDHEELARTEQVRSLDVRFLSNMMNIACRIYMSCLAGYIPESFLNSLYQDVLAAIDEIGQEKDSLLKQLTDIMYVPIRDWIKANLPISCMYQFVKPEVTSSVDADGLTRVDYWFQPEEYYQKYFQNTEMYSRIKQFLEKKKDELLLIEHQSDWRSFVFASTEGKSKVAFSKEQKGAQGNGVMEYVRFLESIKAEEKAFVSKWMRKIEEAELRGQQEMLRMQKEELRKQEAKARAVAEKKKRKTQDSAAMLAQMMRELGVDDDNVSTSPPKNKGRKQMSAVGSSPSMAKEAKGAVVAYDEDREAVFLGPVASTSPSKTKPTKEVTEEERLRRVAEYEAAKAEQKAALEARKQMLLERREAQAAEAELTRQEFHRRAQKAWVDVAFSAKLSPFSSEQRIAPSIFDGSPDFEETMKALDAAGIYVNCNIHSNEKGIARWVGADGKNVMVWFDRPHGAQLRMGESAVWIRSLEKALRNSGRLLSR